MSSLSVPPVYTSRVGNPRSPAPDSNRRPLPYHDGAAFRAALEQERNRLEIRLTAAEEETRLREFQKAAASAPEQPVVPSRFPGGVYFIQHGPGGPVKIGYTESAPLVRMATLQVGTPVRLRLLAWWDEVGRAEEKGVHEILAEYRLTGEWFESCWALWDYMALFPAVRMA